jgi:hypothetical protein
MTMTMAIIIIVKFGIHRLNCSTYNSRFSLIILPHLIQVQTTTEDHLRRLEPHILDIVRQQKCLPPQPLLLESHPQPHQTILKKKEATITETKAKKVKRITIPIFYVPSHKIWYLFCFVSDSTKNNEAYGIAFLKDFLLHSTQPNLTF